MSVLVVNTLLEDSDDVLQLQKEIFRSIWNGRKFQSLRMSGDDNFISG